MILLCCEAGRGGSGVGLPRSWQHLMSTKATGIPQQVLGALEPGLKIPGSRLKVDECGVLWLLHKDEDTSPSLRARGDGKVENDAGDEGGLWDEALAAEVMDLKGGFQHIRHQQFMAARSASNPYEALDEPAFNPFLNRSALKLANIDSILNGQLTRGHDSGRDKEHTEEDGQERKSPSLTFVDLCGGPGGFSEYLLRRCEQDDRHATGWGMTLKEGDCPWNLKRLNRWLDRGVKRKRVEGGDTEQGPCEKEVAEEKQRDRQLHLCDGADGTGDLTLWANVDDLASTVRVSTEGVGVDVVVADGGFGEARGRFDQEHVMVPLILSEVLAMSLVLRQGGSFVCKLFDITLPATLQALAVLSQAFDRISIVKPITSRPASSERYLVCVGRRDACPASLSPSWLPLKATLQGALKGSLANEEEEGGLSRDRDFRRFVRMCNDMALSCQRDACWRIMEEVERIEQGEEEARKERRRKRGRAGGEGGAGGRPQGPESGRPEEEERGGKGAAAAAAADEEEVKADDLRRLREAWRLLPRQGGKQGGGGGDRSEERCMRVDKAAWMYHGGRNKGT